MINIKNKKTLLALIPIIILIGSFLLVPTVQADWSWATDIVAGLASILIAILGPILTLVIKGVVYIASYSLFIKSPAVFNGWVVVRDLSNMFFIVILLIIAFATILRLENYSYKKWLPKLILMALLINFSKTICGLLIDVTQIIMLTFVNAFKNIAGGNFTEMLGLYDSINLALATGTGLPAGAYMLALLYIMISLVVLVTILMVLAVRIVMIWIYVVLSPLAYLLAAFPGGQSYSSQWWDRFTKNLIVGPVLAFFLWLSFIALQTPIVNISNDQAMLGTRGSTTGSLIKFVIAIGMLIGGLKIAQEIGGEAGSIAGKGMSALIKGQTAVTGFGKKWGGKILSGDNMLARKTMKKVGFDFRPVKMKEYFKASYEKTKVDDETAIRDKGISNMEAGGAKAVFGGLGSGRDYMDNYFDGFLALKGLNKARKELFVNPRARRRINTQIDEKDDNVQAGKADLENFVSTQEVIDNRKRVDAYDAKIKDLYSEINKPAAKGEAAPSAEEIKKRAGLIEQKANLTAKRDKLADKYKGKTVISPDDYAAKVEAVEVNQEEMRELKKQFQKYAAPKSAEAESQYRSVINDRKAKFKDTTISDKLIDFYDDAVNRDDKYDQMALLEKLSNDANLNEILNNKGYKATSDGLYKFLHNMENDFHKKNGLKQTSEGDPNGFSEEQILRLQGDLGEAEERVGHWEMAKMVAYNNKGKLVSTVRPVVDKDGKIKKDKNDEEIWDDRDHVIAAVTEITKGDPQKILSMLNRLAAGGEDARGNYHLANLGKVLVKVLDETGTIKVQGNRLQSNMASNLNRPKIISQLKDIGVSQASLNKISEKSADDPADIINDILKGVEQA